MDYVAQLVIIDDSPSALAALQAAVAVPLLRRVYAFADPREGLSWLQQNSVDLLMVDQTTPYLSGLEVIRAAVALHPDIPVIMITSEGDRETRLEALDAGATEFVTKPFDPIELSTRVRNLLNLRSAQVSLADRARMLEAEVISATSVMRIREEEIIWRLSRAMAYRDGETGDHIDRVAQIAQLIAGGLGLSEEKARMIYLATPLHDIGKIAISDGILNKRGPLSPEETAAMRKHVEVGRKILGESSSELIQTAERIVAGHHEKWDGSGYPSSLVGEGISLEARIVAVADVFDALCSKRPYKAAWPVERARDEILKGSGTHFDPDCVAAFEEKWPQIAAVAAMAEAG